jgi:hypothetical protein
MSESFWARKIREEMPAQRPSEALHGPWWATPSIAPEKPLNSVPLPHESLQEAPQGARCPSCGSGNYTVVNGGDPRALHKVSRCFDCGWPVQHTTSGMNSTSHARGEKGTPARQISQMTVTSANGRIIGQTEAAAGYAGHSNYHPQDTQAGQVS